MFFVLLCLQCRLLWSTFPMLQQITVASCTELSYFNVMLISLKVSTHVELYYCLGNTAVSNEISGGKRLKENLYSGWKVKKPQMDGLISSDSSFGTILENKGSSLLYFLVGSFLCE